MPGTLTSRNSTINNVPTGGVQQPTGSLSSGRFASNNLPVALSQVLAMYTLILGVNRIIANSEGVFCLLIACICYLCAC